MSGHFQDIPEGIVPKIIDGIESINSNGPDERFEGESQNGYSINR